MNRWLLEGSFISFVSVDRLFPAAVAAFDDSFSSADLAGDYWPLLQADFAGRFSPAAAVVRVKSGDGLNSSYNMDS